MRVTYTREQILRMALKGVAIDFLRSKKVAEAVAERFKTYLGKHIPPGYLHVSKSAFHPGTWRVDMYVMAHVPVSHAAQQINAGEAERVAAAFQAVFRPEDLVTSWTRPRREY